MRVSDGSLATRDRTAPASAVRNDSTGAARGQHANSFSPVVEARRAATGQNPHRTPPRTEMDQFAAACRREVDIVPGRSTAMGAKPEGGRHEWLASKPGQGCARMSGSLATIPVTTVSTRHERDPGPQPPPARSSTPLVAVLAAVAGVAAALAPPSPTGRTGVDSLMVGISASAVTMAAARAPLWALVLAAGAAITIAGNPVAIAAGVLALLLAIVSRRRRGAGSLDGAALGAISAGLAVNAMARAQLDVAFGLTSLVSIAACTVLFFAGIQRYSRAVRRTVYVAAAVVVVAAVASTVVFGLAALRARHAFVSGVRLAEVAVASLEHGDYDSAAVEFDQAAAALEQAHAEVSSPWARGAGLVPVVAQHYHASVDLSAVGANGSVIVAEALREIDPQTLRVEGGRIDLAAVSALASPLGRVETALEDLHAIVDRSDSPWLIGPAEYEIADFQESIAAHFPQLENALDAIELAPGLLGDGEPRTYLILFTSPVEARGLGGSVASYAELLADDGQLSVSVGGVASGLVFDELTMTADFPRVGEEARDTYARTTGRAVDGVIALDPYVLAALLDYAGPIQLTTFDQQLDRYNAPQFLLHDQYVAGVDDGENIDALDEAAVRMMDALLAGSLPDPTALANNLGPLAADRRLSMWSADPEAQQLLEQVGLAGSIPALDGREGWAVTVSNAAGNKIDGFLSTATWYDSSVDAATGRTSAVIRVELTNTAPQSGLSHDVIGNDIGLQVGTSRLEVSAYSSLALVGATVEGSPVSVEETTETGWNVYSHLVDVPAGEVVTLEFQVEGVVPQPGEVVTWQQPLAVEASTNAEG